MSVLVSIGAIFGTLIIAVMNNLLNLPGVPPFLRKAFKGVIVIGAILLQKKNLIPKPPQTGRKALSICSI